MKTEAVLRIGIFLAVLLTCVAPAAQAQIVDATVYKNITAGSGAFDDGVPGVNESLKEGPATDPAPLGPQELPVDLISHIATADAQVHGSILYEVLSSEITASGRLRHVSSVTGATAAALSGFDAVVAFEFDVATQSEYRLFGWVKSDRNLQESELIACQRNGVVLAGDTRATTYAQGIQSFDETRTAFPNDPVTIECGAVASGGQDASGKVEWRFIARFATVGPTCTDPSGDGQTTAIDALAALQAAVGLDDCDVTVCDVNGSGSNTASDSLAILTLAVGLPFAWDCPIAAG